MKLKLNKILKTKMIIIVGSNKKIFVTIFGVILHKKLLGLNSPLSEKKMFTFNII